MDINNRKMTNHTSSPDIERGVKNVQLLGAISLLEYILLIKEQTGVSRWCVLINYLAKIFLNNFIDIMLLMNSIVC